MALRFDHRLGAQRAIFEKCDLLMTQDPGLPEVNPNFPGEKMQAMITEELLSRPEFHLTKEIPVSGQKRIYVLQNRASLLARH